MCCWGATISFIGKDFARDIGYESVLSSLFIVVTTPTGGCCVIEHVYHHCRVRIHGHTFFWDLLPGFRCDTRLAHRLPGIGGLCAKAGEAQKAKGDSASGYDYA